MRYGWGRYLVRLVAGILWFLLMAGFAAAVVGGAIETVVDFHLGNVVGVVVLILLIGLPLRRQWIDDRAEVLTFFRRRQVEPTSERPDS